MYACNILKNLLIHIHDCYVGAIEISIATMSKEHRSTIDEVYVSGFVPKYLLPNKRPNSLDPFLDPLITEIEDSFIEGEQMQIYTQRYYISFMYNLILNDTMYSQTLVVLFVYMTVGISVNYAVGIAGIPAGRALIRCLLILWTGDYPAQTEIGKFICGGIHACRRCKVEGKNSILHWYITYYYIIII